MMIKETIARFQDAGIRTMDLAQTFLCIHSGGDVAQIEALKTGRCGATQATVSRNYAKLTKLGLIYVEPDKDHASYKVGRLTESGQWLIREITKASR